MSLSPAPGDWVKSTYSSQDGGNCVEWAPAFARAQHLVPVRDSKLTRSPVLMLSVKG